MTLAKSASLAARDTQLKDITYRFCVVLMLSCSFVRADATLLERDLFLLGDGLVTLDTVTGLEWLDLAPTFGLSYNEAIATSYATELGFRHATFEEMVKLYAAVAIFNEMDTDSPFHSSSIDNLPGIAILLDLLGCIARCSKEDAFGQGWIDIGLTEKTSWSFYQSGLDGEVQINDLSGTHDKDFSHFETSNFLVRSIRIPEPPALGLIILSLVGQGYLRGRMHKRR